MESIPLKNEVSSVSEIPTDRFVDHRASALSLSSYLLMGSAILIEENEDFRIERKGFVDLTHSILSSEYTAPSY
ncbi:MAG: hypothetical protein GWN86_17455 [Desulfobacterales bacterium]|nr:hypothetical protein [Desulfobacterales bacterium]